MKHGMKQIMMRTNATCLGLPVIDSGTLVPNSTTAKATPPTRVTAAPTTFRTPQSTARSS